MPHAEKLRAQACAGGVHKDSARHPCDVLWLVSPGYMETGIPAGIALFFFTLCFVLNFIVTHTVISSLLRDNPVHVSEVLAPLAISQETKNNFGYSGMQRRKNFAPGERVLTSSVSCASMIGISDARRIGDMKSRLFRALGLAIGGTYMVLTQNCFSSLIEIFTAGHVGHIEVMKDHMIEALEASGENDMELTNIKLDEVEAKHKAAMKRSTKALQRGINLVGVGYIIIELTVLNT